MKEYAVQVEGLNHYRNLPQQVRPSGFLAVERIGRPPEAEGARPARIGRAGRQPAPLASDRWSLDQDALRRGNPAPNAVC